MKLKRRDFLKSIVPALIGGRKVIEDLFREPVAEPMEEAAEEPVQIDTPTCFSGTVLVGGYSNVYNLEVSDTVYLGDMEWLLTDAFLEARPFYRRPKPRLLDNLGLTVVPDD